MVCCCKSVLFAIGFVLDIVIIVNVAVIDITELRWRQVYVSHCLVERVWWACFNYVRQICLLLMRTIIDITCSQPHIVRRPDAHAQIVSTTPPPQYRIYFNFIKQFCWCCWLVNHCENSKDITMKKTFVLLALCCACQIWNWIWHQMLG